MRLNQTAGKLWRYAGLLLLLSVTHHVALAAPVLTGLDILERESFKTLTGRNVGLITNQTGINRAGISSVQILHEANNVNLVAVFSPEHGLLGKLDIENIADSRDSQTGLQVFSIYGKTRTPTTDMLVGIDTLVFDIQDIGTRFYTYISTMGESMRAAAANDIRFVVLDRPNPINGITVSGPVLDEGLQSFVGFHRLPIRHGMTVGELALMFKAELKLDLDLQVVQIEGWQRQEFFDDTGLNWVNPSPNMRSLTAAILYPGIGLLETTNISVGRGTETPFEWFGAPWLDGERLAMELNTLELPGVSFRAVTFTPDSSKFEGELCGGIGITITDRIQFQSVKSGIKIALKIRQLWRDDWETERYIRLLSNQRVLDGVLASKTYVELEAGYIDGLNDFLQRRATYLIYK
jgi:uncharacterized protein YbbC (DUF1343 family)